MSESELVEALELARMERAAIKMYVKQLESDRDRWKAEAEHLKYKWDTETCGRCNYMRSPVSPCKCGQHVVIGTNDRLRSQLATAKTSYEQELSGLMDYKLKQAEEIANWKALAGELKDCIEVIGSQDHNEGEVGCHACAVCDAVDKALARYAQMKCE